MNKKIVVIGAGPTGLGACARLQQLGHKNWTLIEKNDFTGGLATSFRDKHGFTWDIGGHVIFSHYKYFNDIIDQGVSLYAKNNKHMIIDENDLDHTKVEQLWCVHKRESWIRLDNKSFIPYPFQNNFFHSKDNSLIKECFNGLYHINNTIDNKVENFEDLINQKFGQGIAKHFMLPYNFKVWGYPANQMNSTWIGERVSMVNIQKVLDDYITSSGYDVESKPLDTNWGPNSIFRYPKYGGNGSIWRGVGSSLDESNLQLNCEIVEIDIDQKIIKLSNSKTISYDYIINTMPIDILLTKIIKPSANLDIQSLFNRHEMPKYSKTNIIGLGFENIEIPDELKNKSWMYFPSLTRSPFYRLTVLSNYSPYMVEKPNKQWSLMCETCETKDLPRKGDLLEQTIEGLLNENLVKESDLENLVSKYEFSTDYGYPTPYLKRDDFLNEIEPVLRNKFGIYSRGRFGGWKYEVSNQDHSLMQGVESVDNILFGCEEQTYFYPDHVNSRKETTRRLFSS